jgi:hypothetical protein
MSKKKSSKVASDQPGPEQSEQGSSAGKGKPIEQTQPQETAATPTPEPGEPGEEPTHTPVQKYKFYDILEELETIKAALFCHDQRLIDIESRLPKRRRSTSPISRTRIQIRDKETGIVYPSQNNAYKTLLKNGDLKELVEKGIFGTEPERNSYGWFALKRAWPDRFEELREAKTENRSDIDRGCEGTGNGEVKGNQGEAMGNL